MIYGKIKKNDLLELRLYYIFFLLACLFPSVAPLEAFEGFVEHRQGGGVGYDNQYTKFQIFHEAELPLIQPFLDFRYLLLSGGGSQGGNLGGGLGYRFAKKNKLSIYAYFDITQSRTNYLFTQISPGISYSHPLNFSGKDWGKAILYLNGYFPVKAREENVCPLSFSGFKGSSLLVSQTDRLALAGSNIEAGYFSRYWGEWNVYLAATAYYFKKSSINTHLGWGGKCRVSYKDIINLECRISGDQLFGTRVTGLIGLRIPLGRDKMNKVKNKHYYSYTSRPPERFEPIVLKKETKHVVAKTPYNTPLNFVFVNAIAQGDGTFEKPFSLAQAQKASKPGDVIYLFRGSIGRKGIVLKKSQTLIGAGSPLLVFTKGGEVLVPALTLSRPRIINACGSGVILADGCFVKGIDVINASSHGFFYSSSAGGSSKIKLEDCKAEDCKAEDSEDAIAGFFMQSEKKGDLTLNLIRCRSVGNDFGFFVDSGENARLNGGLSHCLAKNNLYSGCAFASETPSYSYFSLDDSVICNNLTGIFLYQANGCASRLACFDNYQKIEVIQKEGMDCKFFIKNQNVYKLNQERTQ